jgi:hypothetical protein
MRFKDHFSRQAADYAKFRPHYPQELFDYLGGIAPSRQLAWDCGTGNGQAAVGLASVLERVIATDASEKQITNARSQMLSRMSAWIIVLRQPKTAASTLGQLI